MDLTPTNAILLANLRANYGTPQKYDAALNQLPQAVLEQIAVPHAVLQEFRNSSTTATHIAAQKGSNEVQAIEQSNAPKMGCCTVHSLINEPGLLLSGSEAIYVGRANKPQQLSASPLANLSPMRGKSEAERSRVCNEDIQRLIQCLEVRKGRAWSELRSLALKVRNGEHVKLLCWCAPKRCHADAIALVVQGLAEKQGVKSIVGKLRALLPAEQIEVF